LICVHVFHAFLLLPRLFLGVPTGAFSKTVKFRGEAQVMVFLRCQRRLKQGWISLRRISD
jgi:hypothetical protein